MEYVSSNGKEKVLNALQNIERSIALLQEWGKDVESVDDSLYVKVCVMKSLYYIF